MTQKALAKNRVLLVYLVKSILSKGKDFVESAKADMLPAEDPETAETIKIEQDGLEVCFTPKKSPKKFNKEKAEAYLKETLGAQKYSQNFAHFKIEQKAGELPPKELLDQMRKYFTISKVEDVTEDAVKRLL